MNKLLPLFVIYAFFIVLSFVVGFGMSLIYAPYSAELTGTLLIVSSILVILIFIKDFGGNT